MTTINTTLGTLVQDAVASVNSLPDGAVQYENGYDAYVYPLSNGHSVFRTSDLANPLQISVGRGYNNTPSYINCWDLYLEAAGLPSNTPPPANDNNEGYFGQSLSASLDGKTFATAISGDGGNVSGSGDRGLIVFTSESGDWTTDIRVETFIENITSLANRGAFRLIQVDDEGLIILSHTVRQLRVLYRPDLSTPFIQRSYTFDDNMYYSSDIAFEINCGSAKVDDWYTGNYWSTESWTINKSDGTATRTYNPGGTYNNGTIPSFSSIYSGGYAWRMSGSSFQRNFMADTQRDNWITLSGSYSGYSFFKYGRWAFSGIGTEYIIWRNSDFLTVRTVGSSMITQSSQSITPIGTNFSVEGVVRGPNDTFYIMAENLENGKFIYPYS